MILEARCTKCGETFNPDSEYDLEHIFDSQWRFCEGQGELLGEWLTTNEVKERNKT